MAPTPPGPERPSDAAIASVVAEKIRILRLIRALDRAEVNPAEVEGLSAALGRLAEFDSMLAGLLDQLDLARDEAESPLHEVLGPAMQVAEALRGAVVDALPPRIEAAYRRACEEVAASEPEVWLEVHRLREQASRAPRRRGKETDEAADAQDWGKEAERTFASGRPIRLGGQARVRKEEAKPLPPADKPLSAWFARMPDDWRAVTARLHEVEAEGAPAEVAARLAVRLTDEAWLRRYLAERVGASERECLAWILALTPAPADALPKDLRESLRVDGDWAGMAPSAPGAKLRVSGLVHVGLRGGDRCVEVPPMVLAILLRALPEVDPAAAAGPVRAGRQAVAAAVLDAPFPAPELDHWKRIDHTACGRFERWLREESSAGRAEGDPLAPVFGKGPREVRSEGESAAILDYMLFDHRPAPGAPTVAERRLASARFREPDARALVGAVVAARPEVVRVAATEPGGCVRLERLFPPGPEAVLHDRQLSLLLEPGWLLGIRLYAAGPYTFCRLFSDPVAPDRVRGVLQALARHLSDFVRDGGANDPAALVRERPWAVLRAVREHRAP